MRISLISTLLDKLESKTEARLSDYRSRLSKGFLKFC